MEPCGELSRAIPSPLARASPGALAKCGAISYWRWVSRVAACDFAAPTALIPHVPSFYDFALVCQELGQTQSRLQMAEAVGTFLASLTIDEAEIAARFMVGRALEQGEEKRLQISGRAIWKIEIGRAHV